MTQGQMTKDILARPLRNNPRAARRPDTIDR
jgi:hypothetical protein